MWLLTTLMNGRQFYAKPVLAASVMYINQGNFRVLIITANAPCNAYQAICRSVSVSRWLRVMAPGTDFEVGVKVSSPTLESGTNGLVFG